MIMTDESIARYIDPEKPRIKCDVMIYSRYERFWHWTQAALIFTAFFPGSAYMVRIIFWTTGRQQGAHVHCYCVDCPVGLHTFWHFTTGQWKQYLFKQGIWRVVRFYAFGILRGDRTLIRKACNASRMRCSRSLI